MTTKHGVLLVLVCNLMVSMNCQDSPNLDGKMLNVTFELFLEPTTTQPPPTTTQTVPTTEPTVPTTEPTVPTTAAPTEPTTEPTIPGLTPPTTTRASSGPTIPSSTPPTTKTMTASTDGGMAASTDLGMTMSTDEGLTMSTDGGLTMSTDGGMTASTDGELTMTTDGVTNMTTEGVMNMSTGQTTTMGTSQSTGMDSNERTSMSTGQATSTSTGPPTSSSTDPATSSSTDPATSSSTDPATSSSTDPATAMSTDPATSSSTDPATSSSTDPATSSSTDPATSTITEQAGDINLTMMNGVEVRNLVNTGATTQEEVPTTTLLPPSTLDQIQAFLWEAFNETTGFMDIDMGGVTPAAMQAALQANNLGIQYRVILNAKTLSDTGALSQAGLVKELEDAQTNIVASSEDFQGYQVDVPATTTSMDNTIAEVSNNLQSACDQLGPVCSNSNTTCYVNGTISCPSNCVLFMDAHPQCANADDTLTTIFPKGLCTLDIHGYPYCDCGMSSGDIMENFLYNDGCLSSAFVVGIAAGIGGGLILIFMFATIGLAVRKRKQKESKPAVHYNGFNDVTLERAKPVVIIPEDYEPRDHSDRSSRVSAVKETAFSNKGYETFKPDEDHDAEGDLHSYDLLQAQYQHIDPKADYSIKRPTLIQPTNHYDSDDIIIRL